MRGGSSRSASSWRRVWGFDDYDVNLVEVHVSALRRKMEQYGPRIVQTVRGIGYVLRETTPLRQPNPAGHLAFTAEMDGPRSARAGRHDERTDQTLVRSLIAEVSPLPSAR